MSSATGHIICKQTVDIAFYGREEEAFACQRTISRLWEETLPSQLSALLDTMAGEGVLLRIPYLHIELENIRMEDLEARLTTAVLEAVKAQVSAALPLTEIAAGGKERIFIAEETAALEAWLFFLENGYLPGWAPVQRMPGLEEQIGRLLQDTPTLEKIRQALQRPSARRRLAVQCSAAFTDQVIAALLGNPSEAASLQMLNSDVQQVLAAWSHESIAGSLSKAVLELWLQYAVATPGALALEAQVQAVCRLLLAQARPHVTPVQLKALLPARKHWEKALQQISPAVRPQQETPRRSRTKQGKQEQQEAEKPPANEQEQAAGNTVIYIENAGLALLSPFIANLLQACGCITEGRLTEPYKAVYLLQYLVNGDEAPAEFELPLNKILCGIPVPAPLPPAGGLTEKEKAEAVQLLQTVINYWQALKGTSVEGLRQSFLQRKGKLTYSNNSWLLQVAQKPYDMLLEQLPWSIHYIKSSWMPQLVTVEWF